MYTARWISASTGMKDFYRIPMPYKFNSEDNFVIGNRAAPSWWMDVNGDKVRLRHAHHLFAADLADGCSPPHAAPGFPRCPAHVCACSARCHGLHGMQVDDMVVGAYSGFRLFVSNLCHSDCSQQGSCRSEGSPSTLRPQCTCFTGAPHCAAACVGFRRSFRRVAGRDFRRVHVTHVCCTRTQVSAEASATVVQRISGESSAGCAQAAATS